MLSWDTWAIDPSHRCGHTQAACREPAGSYDKTTLAAICFEHKTQYLLICAPYNPIVVFWHISNIPQWFRRAKLFVIPPRFAKQQYLWNIAIQPAVGCYNSWANLRCLGCVLLGEKLLWNRSIRMCCRKGNTLLTQSSTGFLKASIGHRLASQTQRLKIMNIILSIWWFAKLRTVPTSSNMMLT